MRRRIPAGKVHRSPCGGDVLPPEAGEKETPPKHAEVRFLVKPVAVQFSELCPNDATPNGTVLIGVNPFPAPTSQKLFPHD